MSSKHLAIAIVITFVAFQAAMLWLVIDVNKDRQPVPQEQRERFDYAL